MAGPTAPSSPPDERALPDQVTMGLLAYLTAHAVDEDYAEVAARRQAAPLPRPRRPIGLAGALVLAIFAVLAVTAAVQTSQDSVSQERERRALIKQVKDRKTAVDADRRTIAKLRIETSRLEAEQVRNSQASTGLLAQLSLLRLRSGTSPVRGPGVEITVDDAKDAASERDRVLDIDLQKIVNGLWRAGAEAISINRERLTVLSAIRHGGQGITVNFQAVTPPYRILAIGDRNTLPSRFADSSSGLEWLDTQREVGLRFTMRAVGSLRLPAAEVPTLRYAEPPETTQGKRSS
ncbi:MAG: DUF881 domain-containing protein [Propionibacteriales bacterium]|nr:DUF881 domain-containing protein [Propionibacteriales bacterium]